MVSYVFFSTTIAWKLKDTQKLNTTAIPSNSKTSKPALKFLGFGTAVFWEKSFQKTNFSSKIYKVH